MPPFVLSFLYFNSNTSIRYGYKDITPIDMPLELKKRCGDNVAFCTYNSDTLARADICLDLIKSFLNSKFSDIPIRGGLRNICNDLGARQGKCCVGLTHNLGGTGATYSDLFPAALQVYNKCVHNNIVSGFTSGVNLGGMCGKQCLGSADTCG